MTTIRIAHLADIHLDERNRLDDNMVVLRNFVEDARALDVNLTVVPGDFFERKSSPAERNALAEFLTLAAEIAPVFGVTGNHDAAGDLDVFNRLETKHRVVILDRPTAEPSSAIDLRSLGTTFLPGGIACLGLPWFSKAHLCASMPPTISTTDSTEAAIQAARILLTMLRAEAHRVRAYGGIPILAAHLLAAGSNVSTGQTLIGQTVELSPSDLADVGCAYAALGHIHKHQAWGNIVYSGSTKRNNYGEPEAKGWVYVEIDAERWQQPGGVRWRFIELPARRIVLLECDMVPFPEDGKFIVTGAPGKDPLAIGGSPPDLSGALVRFRYRVRPEDLHRVDEDRWRSIYESHGVHEFKMDPVLVHEARVRSTEIVTATSTWEKVQAYWNAKQILVDGPTRERVRSKLAQIEVIQ